MIITLTPMTKVYYLPTNYYWLDETSKYETVIKELEINMNRKKAIYEEISKTMKNVIEKTIEYKEYKSCLIRIILCVYAHTNPDGTGKQLINYMLDKWMSNEKISKRVRSSVYERTVNNVSKYQKEINNIEEILMLISLHILENYRL
jgi:hypothetical protein